MIGLDYTYQLWRENAYVLFGQREASVIRSIRLRTLGGSLEQAQECDTQFCVLLSGSGELNVVLLGILVVSLPLISPSLFEWLK
jgi:hypothetical protein